jgi:hypothetical protein
MEVIGHMLRRCRCTNNWRRLQSQAFKQFAARPAAPSTYCPPGSGGSSRLYFNF